MSIPYTYTYVNLHIRILVFYGYNCKLPLPKYEQYLVRIPRIIYIKDAQSYHTCLYFFPSNSLISEYIYIEVYVSDNTHKRLFNIDQEQLHFYSTIKIDGMHFPRKHSKHSGLAEHNTIKKSQ